MICIFLCASKLTRLADFAQTAEGRRPTPFQLKSQPSTATNTSASTTQESATETTNLLEPRGAAAVAAAVEPVVVPEHVDADLEGKSDYVKASVMARRNALKAQQQRRLDEIEAQAAADVSAAEAGDKAKAEYGKKLQDWSEELGGRKKNIRVLLSTLQNVLWDGAKWTQVGMGRLMDPSRVRAYYLRAVAIVHPDKQARLDHTQQYIATAIFHAVEQAYAEFEKGGRT